MSSKSSSVNPFVPTPGPVIVNTEVTKTRPDYVWLIFLLGGLLILAVLGGLLAWLLLKKPTPTPTPAPAPAPAPAPSGNYFPRIPSNNFQQRPSTVVLTNPKLDLQPNAGPSTFSSPNTYAASNNIGAAYNQSPIPWQYYPNPSQNKQWDISVNREVTGYDSYNSLPSYWSSP